MLMCTLGGARNSQRGFRMIEGTHAGSFSDMHINRVRALSQISAAHNMTTTAGPEKDCD